VSRSVSRGGDHQRGRFFLTLLIALFAVQAAHGDEQSDLQFFENRIRPVLVEHCYECHASDSDDLSGGLLLDSQLGWQAGGDSGAAIVPGDPAASLLLKAISYENFDLQMPPDNRLPENVVADFRKWIHDGAIDPRDEKVRLDREVFDLQERKSQHWAWQPRRAFDATRTIDSYIHARLQRQSIVSSPRASARELIRRVSFDLIGLPPSPDEITAFEIANAQDPVRAFDQLVSRLLNSPAFGEKWASHWFDAVDYSETKGHVTDQERPFAWKYRDYVIDAFNEDLPFDRFVLEHLAGDLLPADLQRTGRDGQNVSPTATGVLYMHEMHFMAVNPLQQRWDEIDAQIDMVGKAFLGLTLECARCHDHKFDAISQSDYYAMAGFFYSTEQGKQRTAARTKLPPETAEKLAKLETEYNDFLESKREGRRKALTPKNKSGDYFPISEELGLQTAGDTANVLAKMKTLREVDPSWSYWVRGAVDTTGQNVPLLIRGEASNPDRIVRRRFLEALSTSIPELSGSGRRWLAEQIIDPANPLTARVYVNRIWHHLFGRGIVSTPNDFGKLGDAPSHPELLDYLANQLIRQNWSTKAIIREIVTSETYQQSSRGRPELDEIDPENRLLSRQNRRRLTAEQLRDSMLSVSGSLDSRMYGAGVDPYVPPYTTANKTGHIPKSGPIDGGNRRSIYIKARRNFYDPFLKAFDFPDRGKPVGRRDVTIVPNQALAMMNSPLVHELATDWGTRLARSNASDDEKLTGIWQSALGRRPTESERETANTVLTEISQAIDDQADKWMHMAHLVFNHADFTWVD